MEKGSNEQMGVITNWGQAIFNALANALNLLLEFIPKLVGFLVILLVGWIIASLVSKAVTFLLRKVGFDRLGQRIGLSRFEQYESALILLYKHE